MWANRLRTDPIPALANSNYPAVRFFTHCDLLDAETNAVEEIWKIPQAQKILQKQQSDGSWKKPGEHKYPAIKHNLIETWRNLNELVSKYSFTRSHSKIEGACEYILSCQTGAGDIRGVLANQYATYYTGAMLSTLIYAGYENDPRTEQAFQWLLGMRQNDSAWSIPMITHKFDRETQYRLSTEFLPSVEPDRAKPFSHNCTGMVLRAFAAHPVYRTSEAARIAAGLLKSRFFREDSYSSYHDAGYWVRFEYPFWWNNLVSAMDTITVIQPGVFDEPIQRAVQWIVDHQEADGLWNIAYTGKQIKDNVKNNETRYWIGLAICRILKRINS